MADRSGFFSSVSLLPYCLSPGDTIIACYCQVEVVGTEFEGEPTTEIESRSCAIIIF